MKTKLEISKLRGVNVIVIKRTQGNEFFITTPDSIIMGVSEYATLLNHLVKADMISYKILEGILEEYHSDPN